MGKQLHRDQTWLFQQGGTEMLCFQLELSGEDGKLCLVLQCQRRQSHTNTHTHSGLVAELRCSFMHHRATK